MLENPRSPQTIASRFLQRTIAGRDHARQCKELVVRLFEALNTIRYFGIRERNAAEMLLVEDMEVRGDTRRRPVRAGGGAAGKRLQDLAVAGGRLEDLVKYWETNVLGRCDDLERILNDEPNPHLVFSDNFLDAARNIVRDVTAADWTSQPPHPRPWDVIPAFFDENVFELAKEQRSDGILGTSRIQLVEKFCWDGVPPRVAVSSASTLVPAADAVLLRGPRDSPRGVPNKTAPSLPPTTEMPASAAVVAAAPKSPVSSTTHTTSQQPSSDSAARLNISCACIDDSDPLVTHVYLATERGMIFTMPIESLFPQTEEEKQHFHARVAQLSLCAILDRRCRADAAAASLPTFSEFQRRHARSGGPPVLDPNALAGVPPSPAMSNLSLPHSSAAIDGAQAASAPNTFIFQEGPIKVFAGHVYRVNSLQLISHGERGKLLVSTSADKTVRWFHATTGALVGLVGPERGMVAGCASYLCNMDAIVTGHLDGSLNLWDVQSGELLRTVIQLIRCPIHSCHVAVPQQPWPSPPGAATASLEDSTSKLLPSSSSTSYTIIVGCRNGHVYGLKVTTHPSARVKAWNDDLSTDPAEAAFAFLPDHAEGSLISMDSTRVCRGGHSKPVVKIASLASYLFTGDTEGTVIKWDLDHREKLMQFRGHIDDITALVATSDGLLFTASKDGLFILWDSATGAALQRVGRHYHQIVGLAVGFRGPSAHSMQASSMMMDASPMATSLSPPASPQVPSSPAASIAASTNAAAKKKKPKRGGRQLQRASEPPFPQIAKQFRKNVAGSRECVALAASTCDANAQEIDGTAPTTLVPFVLTISKDDTMIVWDV
ncbi:WD40 repeat-containing protein, putative [Bodo saltans]|uniref:WD40 repeat-containing protein, putative n=1 Tax=Bodo saltans TaxID=75058 RepID=A0A0S4ITI0_BODSA|nr:WD40 repeat-containing protein, putative [Bodo saltans]|eukprot:CUF73620.1 WD40 repeat-containing protein, putative [Bodo saltans]